MSFVAGTWVVEVGIAGSHTRWVVKFELSIVSGNPFLYFTCSLPTAHLSLIAIFPRHQIFTPQLTAQQTFSSAACNQFLRLGILEHSFSKIEVNQNAICHTTLNCLIELSNLKNQLRFTWTNKNYNSGVEMAQDRICDLLNESFKARFKLIFNLLLLSLVES